MDASEYNKRLVTFGTLIILLIMMFQEIPKDNQQIFLAVATFMLGYYFGNSADKTTRQGG